MHEVVISKLNSDLKLKLKYDDWHQIVWSKKLSPIYCDSTKTFTFLFDQTGITNISHYYQETPKEYNIKLIASMEKSEDVLTPLNLEAKFERIVLPQLIMIIYVNTSSTVKVACVLNGKLKLKRVMALIMPLIM
ncbi:826_t:CDS:2 [Cetraspora pellucida]|uniref:826_t:CDS:1 n=1 Tax=Cetraspora pellucida TaxID=1433469 RepID=A0A9N9EBP1_9GLOM|nr:826_t:CDS:2 [Cetraspora pellucida]